MYDFSLTTSRTCMSKTAVFKFRIVYFVCLFSRHIMHRDMLIWCISVMRSKPPCHCVMAGFHYHCDAGERETLRCPTAEYKVRSGRYRHIFAFVQGFCWASTWLFNAALLLVYAVAQIHIEVKPGVTAAFCCWLCCYSSRVKCLAQGQEDQSISLF